MAICEEEGLEGKVCRGIAPSCRKMSRGLEVGLQACWVVEQHLTTRGGRTALLRGGKIRTDGGEIALERVDSRAEGALVLGGFFELSA